VFKGKEDRKRPFQGYHCQDHHRGQRSKNVHADVHLVQNHVPELIMCRRHVENANEHRECNASNYQVSGGKIHEKYIVALAQ